MSWVELSLTVRIIVMEQVKQLIKVRVANFAAQHVEEVLCVLDGQVDSAQMQIGMWRYEIERGVFVDSPDWVAMTC